MTEENKNVKKAIGQESKKFDTLAVVGGFIVVSLIIWFSPSFNREETIDLNVDTPPPIDIENEGVRPAPISKTIDLLQDQTPRIYPQNVFESFNNLADRIGAKGEFKELKLKLGFRPLNDNVKSYFVSITMDNVSGIYRAYRETQNKINITRTEKLGGIFGINTTKELVIPLSEPILLATTGAEFIQTQAPNKEIDLWEKILVSPPTVFRLMAVPMESQLGDATKISLDTLKIDYTCADGSDCKLVVCDQEDANYYACLLKKFDKVSADSWYKRSGLQ